MPKPSEVAVLIVGGFRFQDWETVWVQHRYGEPFSLFRFTCAEREPLPDRWQSLRFKPGDRCLIELGGKLAMNGYIITRQIAYEANHHGVQLDGRGGTDWAAKSSVESQTHSWDNKNIVQVTQDVLKYYPVGLKVIGEPDLTPFKRLQANPGETVWDFLERIARPRGVILGSDHLGNFLLIGPHPEPIVDRLIEGHNILKCQCIITIDPLLQKYSGTAQTAGGDDKRGTEASEQFATVFGTAPVYSHRITPAEQPVWNLAELQRRTEHEALWHEGATIEAHVTVPGWLRSDGDLWRVGKVHEVNSPMALLKNRPLAIEMATFTQDRNSGTLTTLKMVRPELLRVTTKYVGSDNLAPPNVAIVPPGATQLPPAIEPVLPPGTLVTPSGEIVVQGEGSGSGGGGGGGSGF